MDDTRLPLTEHLAELRTRLVRALLFWAAGAGVAWWAREGIFRALLRPAVDALADEGGALQAIAPGEIFFTYLKGAFLGGFVLALPAILWQLWAFVAPGLYAGEKKLAIPFVVASTLLFLVGAGFGHQLVFPLMFAFLGGFESEFVKAAWTMREVWSMTVNLFLAFGIAFQLPVLVFFLASAGILPVQKLMRYFPNAVLINFIVAAILTPADWVSQVMLAIPMCGLYLLGVGAAWAFGGKRARGIVEEGDEAGTAARA
jgi:sec-independent protein translocase protein TatC